MIDVDIELTVRDGARRFDLGVRFATEAPFAALYGPSGSGKSLTLQAIAGLLKPRAGHVRLDGRTLFDAARGIDLAPRERGVGYLFQHYALFPHLSVRQNIGFGLTTWRRRRLTPAQQARVDSLIERFGLSAMADSRPGVLSGGQQQRVALARALVREPSALLLDEPFAALNPMLRGALRRELAEVVRQARIPALMITHDIDDVLELADVAFVYQDGQVVRDVDLRKGESRDHARRALGDERPVESPMRQKLRHLLNDGPAAG
ncbi:Sulfate/thiosulfate import ATP-binding protein CysA [Pigmentiphaga humi]|uniref:Sulfate/thiosulfate import ATP-binding protein CysA n=1 Tax=Pigmentiphaga humi TaxID=2478468 RepID=A0A3P4AWE3_9BURK|nr:ATP-binding cassette domain-containing protein [Pigmentiphaga humi]VCU68343.1 Sulfate/thiosulfate import ATP-binding protein CysA [Pigmentiphaga humi]